MDCHLSCTSPLPWIWVIEALARSNQVDVSLLLGFLEKTPEISTDLSKNAREMVSLRILESFSVQGARVKSLSSPRTPRIRLDPSESCEDVLRRILSKTSTPNLKDAAPEMSKWDIRPFIEHKRSKLSKYALQELKDAILTGSHSFPASLKEQSGLSVGNQPDHGAPVDDVNLRDVTPRVEGTDANLMHRDPPAENLQPVSRKRRITTENFAGELCKQQIILKNGCKTPAKFVPKSKHDNIGSEQDTSRKLIYSGVDTPLADDSECALSTGLVGPDEVLPRQKEVPHSDSEVSNKYEDEQGQDYAVEQAKGDKKGFRESETINKDVDNLEQNNNQRDVPNVGEMEEGDISGDGDGNNDDMRTAVMKNNASFDCQPRNRLDSSGAPNEEERCGTGEKTHAGASGQGQNGHPGGGNSKYTSSKGLVHHDEVLSHDIENMLGGKKGLFAATHDNMDISEQNVQRNVQNVVQGGEDVDISSDSDGYYEERTIIDTKKKTFLSSQCTYSQESLATSDWREVNFCMKCNKGGEVLVCSSHSCPIVIHMSCLPSEATFDASGEFYCPFCAYSRAISEFTKLRKKSALARKDLAAFLCLGTLKESKKKSSKSCNEPNNRGSAKKDSNRQCRKKLEYEEGGPSTLKSGYSSPFGGEAVDMTNKDKQKGKRTRQVSQSPKVHGKHQKTAREARKSRDVVSEKRSKSRSNKGVLCSPEKDLPRQSKSSTSSKSADAEKVSEEEKELPVVSKYFIRVKKERQYTYPAIPHLRRKNLPWTRDEEEKLKEAMQTICSPHDKVIPWKKILEFGEGTFDKSRNTMDLKDKWRNVCKTKEVISG